MLPQDEAGGIESRLDLHFNGELAGRLKISGGKLLCPMNLDKDSSSLL